eukprot:5403884-Prymnesium_polylepis.1
MARLTPAWCSASTQTSTGSASGAGSNTLHAMQAADSANSSTPPNLRQTRQLAERRRGSASGRFRGVRSGSGTSSPRHGGRGIDGPLTRR